MQNYVLYLIIIIQALLGSELIKTSSEERSLLKNLGSWLGKITIGRNKVLRALEIDPKSLIIEVVMITMQFIFGESAFVTTFIYMK